MDGLEKFIRILGRILGMVLGIGILIVIPFMLYTHWNKDWLSFVITIFLGIVVIFFVISHIKSFTSVSKKIPKYNTHANICFRALESKKK